MFIKNPGVCLVDNRQFPETTSGSHHFKFILIYIGGRSQRQHNKRQHNKKDICKRQHNKKDLLHKCLAHRFRAVSRRSQET